MKKLRKLLRRASPEQREKLIERARAGGKRVLNMVDPYGGNYRKVPKKEGEQ